MYKRNKTMIENESFGMNETVAEAFKLPLIVYTRMGYN